MSGSRRIPVAVNARWVDANPRCLRWEVDGKTWSTSGLVEHIIREATGQPASITGLVWWADDNGLRLHEILEEHTREPVYAGVNAERDWSDLHERLARVPRGQWTSYKDLADAIGSSPIAVGLAEPGQSHHLTRTGALR